MIFHKLSVAALVTCFFSISCTKQAFKPNENEAIIDIKPQPQSDGTIGTVYEASKWSNFNDFKSRGAFLLNNGNLRVPADSTSILQVTATNPTAYDVYDLEMELTQLNGSYLGLTAGIGLESISIAPISYSVHFDTHSKRIAMYNRYPPGSISYGNSETMPTYEVGDKLNIHVSAASLVYNITVTNVTRGTKIARHIEDPYSNPTVATGGQNTNNIAIYSGNTTSMFDVSYLKYSSSFKLGGNWGWGNSIGKGSNVTNLANAWMHYIGLQIDAGPGDRTQEGLAHIGDLMRAKAGAVYADMATNDASDYNGWVARINQFDALMTSAGTRVVWIVPYPNSNVDMRPFRNYLINEPKFAIRVIDDWALHVAPDGKSLKAAHNSGDGTHPNDAGHIARGKFILSSPLYRVEPYL